MRTLVEEITQNIALHIAVYENYGKRAPAYRITMREIRALQKHVLAMFPREDLPRDDFIVNYLGCDLEIVTRVEM